MRLGSQGGFPIRSEGGGGGFQLCSFSRVLLQPTQFTSEREKQFHSGALAQKLQLAEAVYVFGCGLLVWGVVQEDIKELACFSKERMVQSLRLEKTSKITEYNCQPTLTVLTSHVPQSHIHTVLKHIWGR